MEKDAEKHTNVIAVDFKGRLGKHARARAVDELDDKKRELFEKWLAVGTVCVLFDARKKDVAVPEEFKDRGDLRLNFCRNFFVPDFNYNELAVWGSLSFDNGEFFCKVPWKWVYGIQSAKLNQGAVWFESFPSDYDQVNVLGFSEEMCDPVPAIVDGEDDDICENVIALDFSKNNE